MTCGICFPESTTVEPSTLIPGILPGVFKAGGLPGRARQSGTLENSWQERLFQLLERPFRFYTGFVSFLQNCTLAPMNVKIKGWFLLPVVVAACCGFYVRHDDAPVKKGYDKGNLDENVRPCQDFYQYAAGGWMAKNPVPSTESRWGSFNILAKQNEEKLRAIIEELIRGPEPLRGSAEQLVRDFYLSAVDTLSVAHYGYDALKTVFAEIEGLHDKVDLPRLIGYLKSQGVNSLFSLYVSADAKSSGENILYLSQGGINLPDVDYYLKKDPESVQIRQSYALHIEKMLSFSGEKNAKEKALKMLEIESDLAGFSMSRSERRDPDKTYHRYSCDSLNTYFPYFGWERLFTTLHIPVSGHVVVSQPDFFRGLSIVLDKYSVEDWKAYLRWNLIHQYAPAMGSHFEKEHFYFYSTVLRGVAEMKPLNERALASVNAFLGEPMGRLFVQKHFSASSKMKVAEMVEELREVFKERISRLEWMSDSTKIRAQQKLAAFKYKIGYPDEWRDYSELELHHSQYLSNQMNVRIFEVREMISRLGRPVDRKEWSMSPQTVNAYYSSSKNEIVFPAGILQAPFFDPEAEDALNYGGIGAVIGHEFSHGFDDKGSKFDADGNLRNWWTEQDLSRFQERTGKIVAQFNSYEALDGIFINGSLTQGENIADLAGLILAYHALEKHYQKHPAPGVSPDGFTWQQRFFLGWAIVWAQNISEKELRSRIVTDPHSPGRYRVNGPLSNIPEFRKAFSCGSSEPMVADTAVRVNIW
jgi:putative endopeptidase